ncbi:Mycothiol acetyltransferase [Colletotrichum chlorophyti]|uniref:Mycothiol acetyltransferase n=1 Tax=Colletotrichum chlorophyti TaxID=708187 RepID=A0A1Q8RPT7_9PEZI|nr:Mycothiol acetyltransferase [Colletotrichum chlorophyti]
MEGFTLTRADQTDVPAIQSMVRAAYTKYIPRIGKEPAPMKADYSKLIDSHIVYVVRHDESGETVGSIVLRHDPVIATLHINNLVVDQAAQGRGFGRALMQCAEDVAREHGCGMLQLFTNVKMYENLVLYPKMGFAEIERRTEDGYERVYFRKELHWE